MSTSSLRTILPQGRRTIHLGWVLFPILLLVVWHILAEILGDFALVTPMVTAMVLIDGFTSGWIINDTWITVFELTVAYVLVAISGVWLGVLLGLNDFWKRVFEPTILGTYSIPKVTLFPIFLFVFGLGVDSKIAFGWFHGVFPVMILTMNAMTSINDEHLKVAKSLGLSRWQTFREVIVPSILPGLVIGLRLGFSLTFLGIILGEMFAARAGLGYELMIYMSSVQVDRMLAIITLLILIAAAINAVFYAIESKIERGDTTSGVRM
jgi:NitT/TauT family transport system permease protein